MAGAERREIGVDSHCVRLTRSMETRLVPWETKGKVKVNKAKIKMSPTYLLLFAIYCSSAWHIFPAMFDGCHGVMYLGSHG
jgi:hypothetical protein